MTISSTRVALYLGLASTLTLGVSPTVFAQIQVTGGNVSGQAAFFIPQNNPQGNIRLFDLNIQTLTINTPRGTTTTAVFTPQGANFSDANNNGIPDAGDNGVFQGTLAGTAFSPSGSPILYTGRNTVLNYTLNNFARPDIPTLGTLISPQTVGTSPLIFLPRIEATLASGVPFNATLGKLEAGDFSANLTNGLIDLPSYLQLRPGTTANVPPRPPVDLMRRIKFDFRGDNVLPERRTDFDPSDDEIRFVGAANQKFQVQSVGTRGEREIKIDGNIGAIDITLSNLDVRRGNNQGQNNNQGQPQNLDPNVATNFKIEGESRGLFSVIGDNQYSFSGMSRRETKFEFRQGDRRLEGRSDGAVSFTAVPGISNLGNAINVTNYTPNPPSGDPETSYRGMGNTSLARDTVFTISGVTFVLGAPIVLPQRPKTILFSFDEDEQGEDGENTTSSIFSSSTRLFTQARSNTSNSSSTIIIAPTFSSSSSDIFTQPFTSENSTTTFQILVATPGRTSVEVVNLGGETVFVVSRTTTTTVQTTAVAQVGPASRAFPGLVGLRELSPQETAQLDDADNAESAPTSGVEGLQELPTETAPPEAAPTPVEGVEGLQELPTETAPEETPTEVEGVEGLQELPTETAPEVAPPEIQPPAPTSPDTQEAPEVIGTETPSPAETSTPEVAPPEASTSTQVAPESMAPAATPTTSDGVTTEVQSLLPTSGTVNKSLKTIPTEDLSELATALD